MENKIVYIITLFFLSYDMTNMKVTFYVADPASKEPMRYRINNNI